MKTTTNETHRTAGQSRVQKLLHQISRLSREDKRIVLYKLLRMLLGPKPTSEVAILDAEDELFGYFLPPTVRLRLRKTDEPELYRELERRSRSNSPPVPMEEVLKKLRATPRQALAHR